MRILILSIVLAAVPATVWAQQGPRRGATVPARAVQEAAAIRPTISREPAGVRASADGRWAPPARPAKRPQGS